MLKNLTPQPPDKIIAMIAQFKEDPRTAKVDLGVGVYKDETGKTPVMAAVKEAEQRLVDNQDSKSYVGLLGDLGFVAAMQDLVLGTDVPADRLIGAQTPGGTGAIHQLLELVKLADPDATVWYSDPTWPNHPAMVKHLGLSAKTYRYFDDETCGVDFDGMMADLSAIGPRDVVILHGCCHNPTGANLSPAQWEQITDLILKTGAIPFIDFAYQGFGDGLEEDANAVRTMLTRVPQMLIAASCSKNFGLYRDRVGVAFVLSPDTATATLSKGALASLNRLNFSFPPDHGAKVVEIILTDPDLRAKWQAEVEAMRLRMLDLRRDFADALRRASNADTYDFVANHRGMFSRLGISPEQVAKVRDEHGIYIVTDSRINVAGLPADKLDMLAAAIIQSG